MNDYDIPVKVLKQSELKWLHAKGGKQRLERLFRLPLTDALLRDMLALYALVDLARTPSATDRRATYVKLEQAAIALQFQGLVSLDNPKRKEIWDDAAKSFWGKYGNKTAKERAKKPFDTVGRRLGEKLETCRFVVWWNDEFRNFAPGIYCVRPESALAALMVSSIASPRAFARCQREGCGAWFVRRKKTDRFCSVRCGNVVRKAKQRMREKTEDQDVSDETR